MSVFISKHQSSSARVKLGDLFTECNVMSLVPTSKVNFEEMQAKLVAPDSIFLHEARPCYVHHRYDNEGAWKALIHFQNPAIQPLAAELQSIIDENQLSYAGQINLAPDTYPILRITDAREAHLVPKSPSKAQIYYAAKKVNLFPASDDEAARLSFWQLSETLNSMGKTFYIEFWTGLDPQPLLDACIARGLKGWVNLPSDRHHWVLPTVYSEEDIAAQFALFAEIKRELGFRCGFDMKAKHFVYDICQKISETKMSFEYPTNQGIAVGLAAFNGSYSVHRVGEHGSEKSYYWIGEQEDGDNDN